MNLDVEIIRDKNNDPLPQYLDSDDKEGGEDGTLKPLTKEVLQEVILKNLPETQQVEVTNQKEVQDVNVTNQKTSVDVNNFPELQDVSDGQVRAELEQIKATQSQILERLDAPLNTQITDSIVKNGILTKSNKDFIEVSLTGNALGAGKDQIFDVYADEGEIWTLKRFGYRTSRETSAEGEQLIWLYHGEGSSTDGFIMAISGEARQFLRGTIPGRREEVYGGDIEPSSNFEMIETLRGTTVLSDRLPIRIRYRNRSNHPIDPVNFRLFFLVEKVGDANEL